MKWIKKLFLDFFRLIRYLTTARDNETPSWMRILSIWGGVSFFTLSYVAYMYKDQIFTPMEWGGGFAAVATASAAAIRLTLPANAGNDPLPPSGE